MSTPAKHTSGPWFHYDASYEAYPHEDGSLFRTIGPSEYHTVALVRPGNSDDGLPEQTIANAHLIAAAPELLAALKAVVTIADRDTDEFNLARAVIAKAEGGAT